MHNGYLSEESKKKFSIITGILGFYSHNSDSEIQESGIF